MVCFGFAFLFFAAYFKYASENGKNKATPNFGVIVLMVGAGDETLTHGLFLGKEAL